MRGNPAELGSGLVTRPYGDMGIEIIGVRNPSPFLKRTTTNRKEAFDKLVAPDVTRISLVIPPRLEEAAMTGRPIRRAGIVGAGDPHLLITPTLVVNYPTVATYYRDGRIKTPSKPATFKMAKPQFFTSTTKMSAASWSVPAGIPGEHGTCPAAKLWQSKAGYRNALKIGKVSQVPADPSRWICSVCYAGKSNYMHRTSQYTQLARQTWLENMIVKHGIDYTARTLAFALKAHSLNLPRRKKKGEDPRYFRIHDSGDFKVPEIFETWVRVAELLPEIHFWAPTRQWVFLKSPNWKRVMTPNRGLPKNLTLRPSALHINDKAPDIPKLQAGSTSHIWTRKAKFDPIKEKTAKWICPAYTHKGRSCKGGGGPKGEKDCRVCWDNKKMTVSYKAH